MYNICQNDVLVCLHMILKQPLQNMNNCINIDTCIVRVVYAYLPKFYAKIGLILNLL